MKSGDRVKVIETGVLGTVKGIHYHYLDSKNRRSKLLVSLDNGEQLTYGPEDVETVDATRVTE